MRGEESGTRSYLELLNPEQHAAVVHEGSPLLILAGAGTGKTRVITTKIAYLVRERGFAPESILAVTFTNKAAREMRERAAAIEPECERAVIRTFHSFGAWFLRRYASQAGLDPRFTIYDDGDSTEIVRHLFPTLSKQECSRYATAIARAKDYNLRPDSPELPDLGPGGDLARIYAAYEEKLRSTGNVDFGDLIKLPAELLASDPLISEQVRRRFRVVMVDEYQDSNVAQFQLLRRLAGPATYVCVVGDDDQSIYRFRGAEIRNILGFSSTFPGTTTIKLERNYRSTQAVLDLAGTVVSRNSGRLGKTLRATKPGGEAPQLALLDDQDQEVAYCAKVAQEHLRKGGKLSDIAILYRTNAQSLAFEKEFPRRSIPYKIVGALRFYEREEVKDILAYLALITNPRDEIAFRRVVNKPARGLGDSSVEAILDRAARTGTTVLEACVQGIQDLRGKSRAGMERFLGVIDGARRLLGEPDIPAEDQAEGPYSLSDGGRKSADQGSSFLDKLVNHLATESGLAAYHKEQDQFAGTQKQSNIDELANAAALYPLNWAGLAEFLETIELDRSFQAGEGSESRDAITLITMHTTKGLEFPLVIITGLEQGLFPRDDEEGDDLEEQRRLFYVAITRAKDRVFLTACRWRRIRGRLFETSPSRFLTEIPRNFYEFWKPRSAASTPGYGAGMRARVHATREVPREESEWKPGQAVFHDEYGEGEIVKVSMTESSGPLVVVRFGSGKMAQFFPKYTKKLERIRE